MARRKWSGDRPRQSSQLVPGRTPDPILSVLAWLSASNHHHQLKRPAEIRPLVSVRHEQSGPQSAGSDRWPQSIWPRRRYIFDVVCTPTTSLDHRLSMHLTGPCGCHLAATPPCPCRSRKTDIVIFRTARQFRNPDSLFFFFFLLLFSLFLCAVRFHPGNLRSSSSRYMPRASPGISKL